MLKNCRYQNSGLKKRELIEKIEQSSEVQKNDSVPRSAASDFSHRNFDEKTEAPQEHTEREKQFFEELGEGILEVLPDGYGFLRAEDVYKRQVLCLAPL